MPRYGTAYPRGIRWIRGIWGKDMTSSKRRDLRALLFAATAVGALATYDVSHADTADAASAAAMPGAGAGAATSAKPATQVVATADDAATDDTSGAAIQEVVVTAQRREESIQNVPATIQAFTGQVLTQQNIQTLDDLVKYTPNVTFGNNGPGQGVIFMRGLSTGLQGNQSSATIATFPNVALYLDDQSMQFPGRNVDIYAVDLDRVEVLEGPQGTLFGGGAEAGAIRYITNKPKLDQFEGKAEAQYGVTSGGDPNGSFNAVLNVPLVKDKLAVRVVFYDDHQGGYIDNVPSTFTRSNNDLGNSYFGIKPTAGVCPNGLPGGGPKDLCALPNQPVANNYDLARNNFNPVDYQGARGSLLFDINDDWNVLVTEAFQSLDAEGLSIDEPYGSDFQKLAPLQVTSFTPSYDRDSFENTSWTVNGKIGPLKAIYTGSYLLRHISQQMDYSNYSRSTGGMYYECTGGGTGWGSGTPACYSPVTSWMDTVRNTHLSNEFRVSTPDDWRIRGIAGVFQENFRIYDNMNFNYKTIPACNAQNLAIADAGGPICVADVTTAPGSTANDPGLRGDTTAFGEDTQRGYDQIAGFGSVDFDIIPHVLTVTGGTRYYQYKEFEVGSQYETGTECLNVPNGDCGPSSYKNIDQHNDRVTYSGFKSRANVTWHVDSDVLTYFTFSQGFRPGGFNRSVSGVADDATGAPQYLKPNGYAPDSLDNYEIGLKSEFLDHRVQLNVSAYYMNWDNVQLLFFNPTELGNTTFGVNGANYVIKGVELQGVVKPMEGLTLNGSATYNDDRQANSPCLTDDEPGTASFGKCITQVEEKGVGLVPFNNPFGLINSVPAFSPHFQGDIRARYDWLVGDYKAHVQVAGSYTGSQYNQPATYESGAGVVVPNTTLLRYEMPAYGTVDAAIGVAKDNWYAELYGDNLADSHASMFTSSTQFLKSEVPIRPRIVMLKIGASF
jgi:iron complex outermembrane receptor protein